MNNHTDRQITNYILIDYENVQPKRLTVLQSSPNQMFRIMLFVGSSQSKIPTELALSMQSFGDKAKYIRVTDSGKNALDFYIAYYLGTLVERDHEAYFHVISKDTGYDPLIKYLKSEKINVVRRRDLFDIPWLSSIIKESVNEKIDAIVKNLSGRVSSRPRKVKTLKNAINSMFGNKIDQEEIDTLVKGLEKRGYVVINKEKKVTYQKT